MPQDWPNTAGSRGDGAHSVPFFFLSTVPLPIN